MIHIKRSCPVLMGLVLMGFSAVAEPAASTPPEARAASSAWTIAHLIPPADAETACFSDRFLKLGAAHTDLPLPEQLSPGWLDDETLDSADLAVWSGRLTAVGPIVPTVELTESERSALSRFLTRGGVLLFSPSCGDQHFGPAVRTHLDTLMPGLTWTDLPPDHPVWSAHFTIDKLGFLKGPKRRPTLTLATLDGRLVAVTSPEGLGGADSGGGDCCCCGSNELRDPAPLLINLLSWWQAKQTPPN